MKPLLTLFATLLVGNIILAALLRKKRGATPTTSPCATYAHCWLVIGSALMLAAATWIALLPRARFVHLLGLLAWRGREVILLRLVLLAAIGLAAEIWACQGGWQMLKALRHRWDGQKALAAWRRTAPWAKISALALAGLAGFMAFSEAGLRTHALNWYESGVPLLPGQMWLIGGLIIVAVVVFSKQTFTRDGLLALLLWAGTALWWIVTPTPPSFFEPAPVPPTGQPLPWSDALTWDLQGWQLLHGLRPNPFADHLGYSGWLAWLHLWTGTNYPLTITLQVLVLAILPALVYLIGQQIGPRAAALGAALFTAAQGANALSVGEKFNVVHPKMLMTEWPTGLLLALSTLCLVRFGKNNRAWHLALCSGATLGLSVTFRFAALAMLPAFVVGYLWLAGKRHWRQGVTASIILLIGALVVWLPWMQRSQARAGTPWFFLPKVSYALTPWYRIPGASPTPLPTTPTPGTRPARPSTSLPTPSISSTPSRTGAVPVGLAIGEFWLHNLAAHFFTLPLAIRGYDLNGLWDHHPPLHRTWWYGQRGGLTPLQLLGVGCYLLLLAWGLGTAWQQTRWTGLAPLGVALAYHLATAIARTGGGRYIVPVQWVLWLYVGLAIAEVARGLWEGLGLLHEKPSPPSSPRQPTFAIALSLLFIALPLWMNIRDRAIHSPFPNLQTATIWHHLDESTDWEHAPIERKALQAFLRQPGATILQGEIFYPRYFAPQEGIPEAHNAHRPLSFGRLVGYFSDAPHGKGRALSFVLPQTTSPRQNLWGAAYLIGCQHRLPSTRPNNLEEDLLLLIWQTPQGTHWYVRSPLPPPAEWHCPLPAP